jgi:hypothetical protein
MSISGGNLFPGGKRGTTGNVSIQLTIEMNPFTVQFMVQANLALQNTKLVQQLQTSWFKSSDLFYRLPYLEQSFFEYHPKILLLVI